MGKLAGERRALAAAVIGFYMSIFFLMSFLAPEGLGPAFGGLAGVYGAAFFGIVAGYFWARWFAIGIGISGLISAIMSIWQIGPEPMLVIYGATHAAASLVLWGGKMSEMFDGRPEWRTRFHLDEHATNRLGKSVIRVGVSLPYIVLYALAPRESAMTGAMIALGLAGAGAWALFRMRTWGILAIGGAALATATTLSSTQPLSLRLASNHTGSLHLDLMFLGIAATLLLAAAVAPFLAPATKYVRRSDEP